MGNSNHSFGKEDIKEGQKRLIKRWIDSFKEYAWSNQVEECWLYRGDSQSHKNAMCLETYYKLVAVQSLSPVWLSLTPRTVAHQASLPLIISWSLPKFMSIASVILSSILILWCSTLLLPPIFPSIRDFSNESAVHIRWAKYWSFSLSITHSSVLAWRIPGTGEPGGLPSMGLHRVRYDWSDLAAAAVAAASAPVLPLCIQGWFPWRLIGWISLLSKGRSWL